MVDSIDLYRFVMCKYFPDAFKPFIWMNGTEFDRWQEPDSENTVWKVDNFYFKDGLERSGVSSEDGKKMIKFIHINGSHPPCNMDEYSNRTWAGEVTPAQCGRGALRIVQNYVDGLKRLGIYDDSSIIIVGDHGYYQYGALTNPALMIKEKGKKGGLQYSDSPVSSFDLPATILDMAGIDYKEYGSLC